jgi:hypothetical protein
MSDSLSKNSRFACLGVAEVHCLVQQLVHYHKVVSDALFFKLPEVIFKNLRRADTPIEGETVLIRLIVCTYVCAYRR